MVRLERRALWQLARGTRPSGASYRRMKDDARPHARTASNRPGPLSMRAGARHDNYAAVHADIPGEWRQVEWQELARLQGFPED